MKKIKLHISFLILIFCATSTYAAGFFNGVAGIKNAFIWDSGSKDNRIPAITFQSFFAGQFNFTPNIILRTEFSLDTYNLLGELNPTPTKYGSEELPTSSFANGFLSYFHIDEVSATFRQQFFGGSNYVGLYVGQYEPLGTDIFLRRHFNTGQLASKITNSWLGLSGSVIYPRFKAGISDVIHFASKPVSLGVYTYYDRGSTIDEQGISTDFRVATAYSKFYLDLLFGFNANFGVGGQKGTLGTNKAFVGVTSINLQAGFTMLVGNNETPFSFLLQAGLYKLKLNAEDIYRGSIDPSILANWLNKSFYFLLEPRIRIKNFSMDISAFMLPDETYKKLFITKGNIGANINLYGDAGYLGNAKTTFGTHIQLACKYNNNNTPWTTPEDLFADLFDFTTNFGPGKSGDSPRIMVAPYMNMHIFTGEFQTMIQVYINRFIAGSPNAFELHVGYKAHF